MNEFFNRESETAKRRQLRGSMPDAEVILWSRLKSRQLLGCKFRRQYSVGSFVIDFYSVEVNWELNLMGTAISKPARENTTRSDGCLSSRSGSELSGY